MFVLEDCSPPARVSARMWLTLTFGAVHDGGHVDAICSRMTSTPHKWSVVMVNTMAYASRDTVWNAYQNFSSPATQSYVWPDFQFTS